MTSVCNLHQQSHWFSSEKADDVVKINTFGTQA